MSFLIDAAAQRRHDRYGGLVTLMCKRALLGCDSGSGATLCLETQQWHFTGRHGVYFHFHTRYGQIWYVYFSYFNTHTWRVCILLLLLGVGTEIVPAKWARQYHHNKV